MSDKGIYISKTAAIVSVVVGIAIIVAEGLLIGLLVEPSCDNVVVEPTKQPITTIPSKTTTKPNEPTPPTTTNRPITSNGQTTSPPNIWDNPRLPTDLVPSHYVVELAPVLELDVDSGLYLFYGNSTVHYLCQNPTKYVIMHSRDLSYTDPMKDAFTITDENTGNDVTIIDAMLFPPNYYLVITTELPCEAGHVYHLTASNFWGELGDDLDGLYRSEYINEYGVDRVIAASQMETDGARQTFPCFDEPALKATFDMTLYHRSDLNYTAVSNMPIINHMEVMFRGDVWNVSTFNTTPVMPTYLLALTVTDFTYEESNTSDGIQTWIYARNIPINNGEANWAAEVTPLMLEYMAAHYNVSYPLEKSDQMAIPDFGAGAMENWGLVLYREIYLLYDEDRSSVYNKLSVTQVIAHELGHQWFGNLVTMDWWSDIWLNEGFASYLQYIGMYAVNPLWRPDELFIIDDLQGALSYDSYSTSHPLFHPQGYFSTISYSKGAAFLRMVNNFLGETTFTNALTKYLNENKYGVVTRDMLFEYWAEEARNDGLTFPFELHDVFETWVLQMGYPLLTVERDAGNNFVISQEYFLVDPEDEPVETDGSKIYNYKWYVPFTYKLGASLSDLTPKSEWIEPDSTNIAIPNINNDFILGNIDAVGFYRVMYDSLTRDKINEKLLSPSFTDISPQSRAQLIDDIFAVTRAQKLEVEEALKLSQYLKNELGYIPWETFLSNTIYFQRILGRSVIYGDFSKYILDMIEPSIYTHYGWDDSDTSDDVMIDRMARGLAIQYACEYEHPDCLGRAVEMYSDWMSGGPITDISTTYRSYVFCTAIRAGGVEEWDAAWKEYEEVDSAHEKTNLRRALSCSKDPWILNRYIEYALDGTKVRRQDASNTLSYIGGQEYGKYVAWSFALNNWDRMMNTVGSSPTSSMLRAAVRRFSTQFDLELIDLLGSVAGSNWAGTIQSYKDTTTTNMKWREYNEQKIADWLGSDVVINNYDTPMKGAREHPLPHIQELDIKNLLAQNKRF